MRKLPSGTVTLLFTDIEGSTRLLQELGRERYVEALEAHRRVLREAFTGHGGVEVELQGDSFHFAFPYARDAVAAAATAQRALAEEAWEAEPIRVRIGLHSGEPVESGGLYAGLDVHRAARVMQAAHGGQVLVSQATRELVGGELPAGLSLRDLGEHRLKDLTEPQRLSQLVIAGLASEFPPPATLENRPTNLPVQPTSLIGRERELGEVIALLRRDDVRLLTLTGPGGTGKTRLALQAAAELIEAFPQGVWFVNLAPLTDAEFVLPTIAQTLGMREQPGEPLLDTVARELADQRRLLVLDNFEQVADAGASLARLLARAVAVTTLVTSRAPLRLSGEREYAVPPLAAEEAILLFAERAEAVKASFRLNGNRPLVAEICRRLDHLPLAIELAAARVKLLPERALLERLDQKLKLLTGGARDRDQRQRTLRAAIDWSHNLLGEQEQTLLRRLAAFRGGASLEAIERVCAPDGLDLDLLDGLESLIDNSLLRQEEGAGDEPRYRMLETIHEYARERLEQSGEAEELRRRQAGWVLDLAAELSPALRRGHPDAVGRMAVEDGNVRAAVEWSIDRDPSVAHALFSNLSVYWLLVGNVAEGVAVAERFLAADAAVGLAERLSTLIAASEVFRFDGDFRRAIALEEQALALLHAVEDEDIKRVTPTFTESLLVRPRDYVEVAVRKDLAQTYAQVDDVETARGYARQAVERARALGDDLLLANALYAEGIVDFFGGRYAAARDIFASTLETWTQHGWLFEIEGTHLMVGECLRREGQVSHAERELHAALELCASSGSKALYEILQELAAVEMLRGRPEAAARLLGASARARDDTGATPWDPGDLDRTKAGLRRVLGDQSFEHLHETGAALTRDEALEFARSLT